MTIAGTLTVRRWNAGASTWGNPEEEAFKHIHEVVRMVIAELIEDCIPLSGDSA